MAISATVLLLAVAAGWAIQHRRAEIVDADAVAALSSPRPRAPAIVATPSPAIAAVAATPEAAPATTATAAAPGAPTEVLAGAVGPTFGIAAEAGDRTTDWLVSALSQPVQSSPGVRWNSVPTEGWQSSLSALDRQPRVTVVRYDALKAARGLPSAALPNLEIIAPLSTEPVYFVVRANSPLEFIHEIKGKSIDAGGAGSSRSLTARAIYRGLFDGTPMPRAPGGGTDVVAALQTLRSNPALDVVVVMGAALPESLAAMPPSQASEFKVLRLQPGHAALRKVSDYLPVRIGPGLTAASTKSGQTLGVMSFLVSARPKGAGAAGHDRQTAALATALCSHLRALRADPTGSWRAVDPGLQLDVGWPYSKVAQDEMSRCAAVSAATTPPQGSGKAAS